jgi:hypothetical protein
VGGYRIILEEVPPRVGGYGIILEEVPLKGGILFI